MQEVQRVSINQSNYKLTKIFFGESPFIFFSNPTKMSTRHVYPSDVNLMHPLKLR